MWALGPNKSKPHKAVEGERKGRHARYRKTKHDGISKGTYAQEPLARMNATCAIKKPSGSERRDEDDYRN